MTRHAATHSALSALSVLLLAGCLFRDDASLPAPIVPLAAGNSWTYVDSALYRPDSVGIDSTRTDILGERVVTVNGSPRTVYLSNTRDRTTGLPGALTLYVRNGPDGEYTVGATRDSGEVLFETLHVKHPGKRGERYVTYFVDLRAVDGAWEPVLDTVEIEVAVPDTVCATPAGTFRCTEYRGRRAGVLFARTWYAPGVGYLGSDVSRTIDVDGETREVIFRKRLARYTLH